MQLAQPVNLGFSTLLCTLIIALVHPVAQSFVLITEEEARASQTDTDAVIVPMSSQVGFLPAIEVVNPQIMAGPVLSPLSIELFFRTDGAEIDFNSFQAHYGSLRLNITERIMERAILTDSGLRVDDAQVPRGGHRLFLGISDVKGRRAYRELRIQVQ